MILLKNYIILLKKFHPNNPFNKIPVVKQIFVGEALS